MEFDPTNEDPDYIHRKYQELIDETKLNPIVQHNALEMMTKTQEYLRYYIDRYEDKEKKHPTLPTARQKTLIAAMNADPELQQILEVTALKGIIAALSSIVGDLESAKRRIQ